MIVHGLDKERNVVEKELIVTQKDGAVLSYAGESVCIEPDYEVWEKIWESRKMLEGFTCAFMNITNRCNKKCGYCYPEDLKIKHLGGPSLDQLINTVKEFIPNDKDTSNVEYKNYDYDGVHPIVRVIGGEPTVVDHLPEFLNWAVENTGLKYWVCTNGINQQNKSYFKNISKSRQIIWALSVDWNTTDDFIKRWVDNIQSYGGNNEFSFGLIINNADPQNSMRQDSLLRTFHPQEIRYRSLSKQDGSLLPYTSKMMKFVEESRGIPKQLFLDKAKWVQQILTCLSHKHLPSSDEGNIVLARLAVYNITIMDLACRHASYLMTTPQFWNPTEGHCSSPHAFKFRMRNTDKYYKPESHIFWGKYNPYTLAGKR